MICMTLKYETVLNFYIHVGQQTGNVYKFLNYQFSSVKNSYMLMYRKPFELKNYLGQILNATWLLLAKDFPWD